uniref:enoyl-CoA hydratase n=1 Tax=Globodera pallida TaxID=36090 RepID=A0A183BV89_GLOPA
MGSERRFLNIEPHFNVQDGQLHGDLISDWVAVLLNENRIRMESLDNNRFRMFVNQKTVQYVFTICLRLRLPQGVKYIALNLFNSFMCAHIKSLYDMVMLKQPKKSEEQRKREWERILTTVSRQVTLRTVSCIQIASKMHSHKLALNVPQVRTCLQSLGYAYTEEAIRNSEIRILVAVGFCMSSAHTPITYVESFLNLIYRMNSHLKLNVDSLWEYSVLILDCVFLDMDEFYKRILLVVHGNRAEYVSRERILRIEADYALLASGVICIACICIHGRDFISSVMLTLQRITGIPADHIVNVYTGMFQTIYDHLVGNSLAYSHSALTQNSSHKNYRHQRMAQIIARSAPIAGLEEEEEEVVDDEDEEYSYEEVDEEEEEQEEMTEMEPEVKRTNAPLTSAESVGHDGTAGGNGRFSNLKDECRRLLEVPEEALDREAKVKMEPGWDSRFWVPDAQEGFKLCEVRTKRGDHQKGEETEAEVEVLLLNEEEQLRELSRKSVRWECLQRLSVSHLCENLCQLSELNDSSVLASIRQRYSLRLIHTYSGLFCVVVNPWRSMAPLYCGEMRAHYANSDGDLPPHRKSVRWECLQRLSVSHLCENLCQLSELNDPSVLASIRQRYSLRLIHTYSGLFCVVVNPWRSMGPLYCGEMRAHYANSDGDLPPHVFAIAQNAFEGISDRNSRTNQSILITGESGAGKTENTKRIIEYLMDVAERHSNAKCFDHQRSATIEKALISAGTALEAFANAQTVHNNNSSRMGKFVRIDFDRGGKLHSAQIDCYLLEKSRVTAQEECVRSRVDVDEMGTEVRRMRSEMGRREEELGQSRERTREQQAQLADLNRALAEANDRLGEMQPQIYTEKSARRKAEGLVEHLEAELCRISDEMDKANVRRDAMRKSVRWECLQRLSVSHLCENLCQLSELNDPSVLASIRQRYGLRLIHTYSGLFCVVVNPWRSMGPLYCGEMRAHYANSDGDLPPHVFAIAQNAFEGISDRNSRTNQSILITGESGAGKTENTKRIIEYLMDVAERHSNAKCFDQQRSATIEKALISAGTALEAFANAQTVHNNNSSRMGKFVRIDFDRGGKLHSAQIDCYLLEKSRVVSQNAGDSNFHIFYQLFARADFLQSEKASRVLCRIWDYRNPYSGDDPRPEAFRFLSQGRTADSFALDQLGFSGPEKGWVRELVTACTIIGQIRFGERQGMDISFVEEMAEVEAVAELLGIRAAALVDSLTQPTFRVGDALIRRSQPLRKTLCAAQSLAKCVYERLFAWIVSKCNLAICGGRQGAVDDASLAGGGGNKFVGVLDMAGFEIMARNSFEQLCINYTNERLQQFFNEFMFVREQEEYRREGISWEYVKDFGRDLQPTIDLIEKPLGMLSLLQEECIVPNGSDRSLLEKFVRRLSSTTPGGTFFKAKQSSRTPCHHHFTIEHYAGPVSYSVDGWLEKNRDAMDGALLGVLATSSHPLAAQLFAGRESTAKSSADNKPSSPRGCAHRGGSAMAQATISHVYREQLAALLRTLRDTQAHFIRCIVPNHQRHPFVLDGSLVMHQLRCNGVLEGIRICRQGYPNRIFYANFLARFRLLHAPSAALIATNPRDAVQQLLGAVGIVPSRYQLGRSKVFCRVGLLSQLEAVRRERLNDCVCKLQAWIRWARARKDCQRRREEWSDNAVTWSLKGQGIAVLKIDIPDVKENTLNEAVSEDLRKAFDAIEQNSSVRGVVLMSNKPNSFVAGADIGMLSRCNTADAAARISRDAKIHFDRMEGSKKPIVAAISGSCMGGGLEMALACHYRIALNSSKTQFALPEVMLGLLPGAGGTQRLPKLISLQNTLDMMLTGKTIRPDKAKKMGFIQCSVRHFVHVRHWPWFRLWLRVRQLIPLVAERRQLAALEEANGKLNKELAETKRETERARTELRECAERVERNEVQWESDRAKAAELSAELRRNEELLERMERKFDDQHAKIVRLNGTLGEHAKALERLEEEKSAANAELLTLRERHRLERIERESAEEALRLAQEECVRSRVDVDEMGTEVRRMRSEMGRREEELGQSRERTREQQAQLADLNRALAEANDRLGEMQPQIYAEKSARRKAEGLVEHLEAELCRISNEMDKANVRRDAMKEQIRVRDAQMRKLERNLEDKSAQMEECVQELKRAHKRSQNEVQEHLEECRRKCLRMDTENAQLKCKLESQVRDNASQLQSSQSRGRLDKFGSSSALDSSSNSNNNNNRESSVDSDCGGGLCRSMTARHSLHNASSTNYPGSLHRPHRSYRTSTASTVHTEPFSVGVRRSASGTSTVNNLSSVTTSSSSVLRRHENATANSMVSVAELLGDEVSWHLQLTSLTTTIDSGLLTRSPSSTSTVSGMHQQQQQHNSAMMAQRLDGAERRVMALERELQQQRQDAQMARRELEVYKQMARRELEDSERTRDTLSKQLRSVNAEMESMRNDLKKEQEQSQTTDFDSRKMRGENNALRQRLEDEREESRAAIASERKKHAEKADELANEYNSRLRQVGNAQRRTEQLQTKLAETESQLDRALGQLTHLERLQKTQNSIGETWETQYRTAQSELQSVRDENAALKSKMRRQQRQIVLLTQQSELDSRVNELEERIGSLGGTTANREEA